MDNKSYHFSDPLYDAKDVEFLQIMSPGARYHEFFLRCPVTDDLIDISQEVMRDIVARSYDGSLKKEDRAHRIITRLINEGVMIFPTEELIWN